MEKKRESKFKFAAAIALSVAMVAGAFGALCGCGKQGEQVMQGTQAEQSGANSMEIEMSEGGSPVKLAAKQVVSANDGIAAQSESSFHLTATVAPPDAVNAIVDYVAAWENGGSGWASGKDVADYITITHADGAVSADVACKQAFGEPIIVTAYIRGDEEKRDSCKFNYVRKLVGTDYTITAAWSGTTYAQWNFNYTNLNPTVDFIKLTTSYSLQDWVFGWANQSTNAAGEYGTSFTSSMNDHYDGAYTKSYGDYYHWMIYVAATQSYLDALYDVGFTTVKVSAGQFVQVSNHQFADIVLDSFVSRNGQKGFADYSQYTQLKEKLRAVAGQDMIQLKILRVSDASGKYSTETTYNIKFSSSSVQQLAERVTLSAHELEF